MIKYVTEENFEKEVLKNEKPVLVDFYADWCGPCRMVAPILEKMSKENDSFDIAKINVDENENLSYEYGIQSIPTMIVFNEGTKVETMIGFSGEEQVIDLMKKYTNK